MITSINKYKLYIESISVPTLRLPKQPTKTDYTNINWTDIELNSVGDDGHKIIHLGVYIDNQLEEGITIDVQPIGDFYQLHTAVHKDLQKQGLASKIYTKFIHEFGNLYSSKGRRMNNNINKILNKFKNKSLYTYLENERNDILIILNTNPDKDNLIKKFKNNIKHFNKIYEYYAGPTKGQIAWKYFDIEDIIKDLISYGISKDEIKQKLIELVDSLEEPKKG